MFQFEPNPTRNASTMFSFVDTIYLLLTRKLIFVYSELVKLFLQNAVKINR